jgi:hypothetical protein
MSAEDDLIKKLMISKQIMQKHDTMGRAKGNDVTTPMVEEFTPVAGQYNIPQELMMESRPSTNYNTEIPSEDRIKNSKLPDEIKRLMLEHPIEKPNVGSGTVLSNDLVEKASRVMNTDASGKQIKPNQPSPKSPITESVNINNIRGLLKEVVEEVLNENGLIVESETNSNEIFKFRVGQHIFEGKLTKIKKLKD